MKTRAVLSASILASSGLAQQAAWGQCGGDNWTGETACVTGYVCTYSNPYYSQCLPGTATTLTTTTQPTSSSASSVATSSPTTPASGKLKWFGVDESCAEFGTAMPGTDGVDYTFASTDTIGVSFLARDWTGRVADMRIDAHGPRVQYLSRPFRHGAHGPRLRRRTPGPGLSHQLLSGHQLHHRLRWARGHRPAQLWSV
jgi:hypothetical protein